jgi:hypothetical protein
MNRGMNPDPTKTVIVYERTAIKEGRSIEVGQSTWAPEETSIRNRYDGAKGKFSPRGSSEIAIYDLGKIMEVAAKNDLLKPKDCAAIIADLEASIARQS